MWIFTPTSFLSIVAHRDKPGHLLVRARLKGDIERIFPRAKVLQTRNADYLYRATVTRAQVAKALTEHAMGMQYDNVKEAVPRSMPRRSVMMSRVWSAGLDEQDREVYPSAYFGLSLL